MFIIRVEKRHWAAFGVGAERFPRDNETDLERAICASGGLVHSKGLLEDLQLT